MDTVTDLTIFVLMGIKVISSFFILHAAGCLARAWEFFYEGHLELELLNQNLGPQDCMKALAYHQ